MWKYYIRIIIFTAFGYSKNVYLCGEVHFLLLSYYFFLKLPLTFFVFSVLTMKLLNFCFYKNFFFASFFGKVLPLTIQFLASSFFPQDFDVPAPYGGFPSFRLSLGNLPRFVSPYIVFLLFGCLQDLLLWLHLDAAKHASGRSFSGFWASWFYDLSFVNFGRCSVIISWRVILLPNSVSTFRDSIRWHLCQPPAAILHVLGAVSPSCLYFSPPLF